MLIARPDRLLAQVRSVVQIASVLGQEFEVPVLAHMISGDPEVKRKRSTTGSRNDLGCQKRTALPVPPCPAAGRRLLDAEAQERLRELHALAGSAIDSTPTICSPKRLENVAFHYEKSGLPNAP